MAEKEYIEREATQMKIKELCDKYRICYGGHYGGFAKDIANVTSTVPAADVQEVRYGKWLRIQNYALCTGCKHEVNWGSSDYLSPFCPNCGAKMDKE